MCLLQAEFEFEFVTPLGVAALANAREAGEPAAAPGGLVRHTYERTPAMSTYLVAVGLPIIYFSFLLTWSASEFLREHLNWNALQQNDILPDPYLNPTLT